MLPGRGQVLTNALHGPLPYPSTDFVPKAVREEFPGPLARKAQGAERVIEDLGPETGDWRPESSKRQGSKQEHQEPSPLPSPKAKSKPDLGARRKPNRQVKREAVLIQAGLGPHLHLQGNGRRVGGGPQR